MLEPWTISSFYINQPIHIPKPWELSQKHVRLRTLDDRFVKLNKVRYRLNERSLRNSCIRHAPAHVYFSVLNWLFPERVGKKYKANRAVPVSSEYVVDIDSHMLHRWHEHYCDTQWHICKGCLEISKDLALLVAWHIQRYYQDIHIVFSGRSGFHIHVLDFNVRDWTHYNEHDPIKSHEAARFKFTKTINLEPYCFDRSHFIVSTDPMRVVTVPSTLNGETGLVCTYIGRPKDLERQSLDVILWNAKPLGTLYGYPEPVDAGAPAKKRWNQPRVMNPVHTTGEGNIARVTARTPSPTALDPWL